MSISNNQWQFIISHNKHFVTILSQYHSIKWHSNSIIAAVKLIKLLFCLVSIRFNIWLSLLSISLNQSVFTTTTSQMMGMRHHHRIKIFKDFYSINAHSKQDKICNLIIFRKAIHQPFHPKYWSWVPKMKYLGKG